MKPSSSDDPQVPMRDTPQVYGKVTRVLHWSMAMLLLWMWLGMGLRLIFGRQEWLFYFVRSHQPVGTVLFVLIVLRILWALINRGNRPPHGEGLVGIASRIGHLALYALMLVVPSLALLRAWGSDRAFDILGIPVFSAKDPAVEWTATLADALHGELAWLMSVLVLGHVVMVGVHQAMWRDGTLARMASRGR